MEKIIVTNINTATTDEEITKAFTDIVSPNTYAVVNGDGLEKYSISDSYDSARMLYDIIESMDIKEGVRISEIDSIGDVPLSRPCVAITAVYGCVSKTAYIVTISE